MLFFSSFPVKINVGIIVVHVVPVFSVCTEEFNIAAKTVEVHQYANIRNGKIFVKNVTVPHCVNTEEINGAVRFLLL